MSALETATQHIESPTCGRKRPVISEMLRVIHAPGHCLGQVVLLWQGIRLLIAGDVFINVLGVGDPISFENEADGRRSQRKLADLAPEAICFGHGKSITKDAAAQLRRAAMRR